MDLPEIKGNHRKFRTLVTSYIGKNAMFTCSHLLMRIIVIRLHSHHIWVLVWFDSYYGICVHFEFPFFVSFRSFTDYCWAGQNYSESTDWFKLIWKFLSFFHSNWTPIWFIFSFDLSPCECPCVLSFLDGFSFQQCVDGACIPSIHYRREVKRFFEEEKEEMSA